MDVVIFVLFIVAAVVHFLAWWEQSPHKIISSQIANVIMCAAFACWIWWISAHLGLNI